MRTRTLLPSALLASAASGTASSHFDFNARPGHQRAARASIDINANVTEVEMVATSWYAGWHAGDFPLDNVTWDKYTQLTYAFAIPTDDPSNITLSDDDVALLPQFVAQAHENDVKASLSIGGWSGSISFSTSVGDATNRTKFVKAVTGLAETYELDGIDFDWEYPGRQGSGCNAISPNDTANFLSFLQELRNTTTGTNLTLTAPVSITPFASASGVPSSDVSAFANVLDFIVIMNYDIWGSWSASVGPNAPLNDTCAPQADQQGSAVSAVAAWTAAGIPASQIVLGVASYGHSFAVNSTDAFVNGSTSELAAYPAFDASIFPNGDAWSEPSIVCGVLENQPGIQDFWNLVESGMLLPNGSAAPNTPHRFDGCSMTDYVYNTTAGVMISYDGPEAFAAKGSFIQSIGLRGFAMWEAGGDKDDVLIDAIRSAAGFEDSDECDEVV